MGKDSVYLLPNSKRAIPLVPTPPPFRNHGNHVTSVAQLGRWLSDQAEEAGVYILGETAATKLLVEDGQVLGVRSGDKGRGRDGQELSNFEPGSDLIAKATVLAEGTQGHLTGAAIRYFDIGSEDPQQWELGVKEVWEVERPLDRVIHTMAWPLRFSAKYREFGGSFIYPMGEDRVSMGFVCGLDYRDATFSVHDTLQLLKQHPLVAKIIEGGKRVGWGAKTIPSGGYWAQPKQFWAPGMALVGDGAGMVNIPTLKGVHYAMHAGMFAAEAIYERLKTGEEGVADLSNYQEMIRGSEIEKDTRRSRNMRQPFAKGFLVGGAVANMMEISGGRLPGGRWKTHDDATVDVFIGDRDKAYPKPDGKVTFDKLSSVFATGNATRDDAPNHIRIQDKVPLEVALDVAEHVPRGGLRGAGGGARGGARGRQREARRQARGQAPDHALELRAVRSDHRQGWPAHAAGRRRRPELPGDLRAGDPQARAARYCARAVKVSRISAVSSSRNSSR